MMANKFPYTLEQLKAKGYARTSNRHRMVSRIDRADWREHMAERAYPAKYGHADKGRAWVKAMGVRAGDQYRRVYTEDTIEGVPASIYNKLPNSGDDDAPQEYMP